MKEKPKKIRLPRKVKKEQKKDIPYIISGKLDYKKQKD